MTASLSPAEVQAIRARVEAATPGPWRWAGNIDTGEPYLASRAPGMGASVLAIGQVDRSTTGRRADEVRAYARENGVDPDKMLDDWALDRYGEPIKDPQLWFYRDHLAVEARDHVTFEVAPDATSREDRRVYRADIVGIRHPDAEFIAHARTDLPRVLDRVEQVEAEYATLVARVQALADGWATEQVVTDHADVCAAIVCATCEVHDRAVALRALVADRAPVAPAPDPADPLGIVTPKPKPTCPDARFGRPHTWVTGAFYVSGRLIESDDYVMCGGCGQIEYDPPVDPAPEGEQP